MRHSDAVIMVTGTFNSMLWSHTHTHTCWRVFTELHVDRNQSPVPNLRLKSFDIRGGRVKSEHKPVATTVHKDEMHHECMCRPECIQLCLSVCVYVCIHVQILALCLFFFHIKSASSPPSSPHIYVHSVYWDPTESTEPDSPPCCVSVCLLILALPFPPPELDIRQMKWTHIPSR